MELTVFVLLAGKFILDWFQKLIFSKYTSNNYFVKVSLNPFSNFGFILQTDKK